MTAATAAPAAARRWPTTPRAALLMLRLLRLELRHNAMLWLLPVAIGLFWLTTYHKAMAVPPLWNLRAAELQSGAVLDFAVPVTGAAAWSATREARLRIDEQTAVTALPRWGRRLAPWLATTIWAMAAYAGCAAVLYGVTAHQASWGGPLWWPAVVVAASLPAFSAFGFVLGTALPSRFTAPLASVAGFFALALSTELIHGSQSAWQVSPVVTGPWDLGPVAGVAAFYPFVPDLAAAQVMFLVSVTVALLGLLALPAGAASRSVRAIAACLTAAAVLAAGTAVLLTGTGTMDTQGMISIPALHDAADDEPLHVQPVCSDTAIPVCLNPAFTAYLPGTAKALAPLLDRLAGLPGAPTRILQVPVTLRQGADNGVTAEVGGPRGGDAPGQFGLVLANQQPGPSLTAAQIAGQVVQGYGPALVARVLGSGPGASPAQNAVAQALLTASGAHKASSSREDGPDAGRLTDAAPGTPAYAAVERFAALPARAQHVWLLGHVAELRAGRIALEQIP